MAQASRPIGVYVLIVWMALNIVLFALLIPGDAQDLNNYIEIVFWVISAVSLWSMKKSGVALVVAVLCITLGTSMGNVLLAYYTNLMAEPVAYVNALRIVLNAVAAIYLFRLIFANKFK